MTHAQGIVSASVVPRLQTPGGNYAMLALDQRESMRGMFSRHDDGSFVGDTALRDFKRDAVAVLSPYVSAVLLDRPFGMPDGKRPAGIADGCGLIVAVDFIHQKPGEEIASVTFDDLVTTRFLGRVGADAIKVIVLWRRKSGREERSRLVRSAMQIAGAAGVASLVEGVVRPDLGESWSSESERHEAILACAEELIGFGPDIYKAEVPGYSRGDVSKVAEQSSQMSRIVGRDWVVLSNGVERSAFADAVSAACSGGAKGFLAGRAIWADVVNARDPVEALREHSVSRLQALESIVDGRPG